MKIKIRKNGNLPIGIELIVENAADKKVLYLFAKKGIEIKSYGNLDEHKLLKWRNMRSMYLQGTHLNDELAKLLSEIDKASPQSS